LKNKFYFDLLQFGYVSSSSFGQSILPSHNFVELIHNPPLHVYSPWLHLQLFSSEPSWHCDEPSHTSLTDIHWHNVVHEKVFLLHVQLQFCSSLPSPQSLWPSHNCAIDKHIPDGILSQRNSRPLSVSQFVVLQLLSSERSWSSFEQSIAPSHTQELGIQCLLSHRNCVHGTV
jgi:hypothetical protein